MLATRSGAAALLLLAALPLLPAASADPEDSDVRDLLSGCTAHVLNAGYILYLDCGTVPAMCVDLIVAYACTKEIDTETWICCILDTPPG